jgi:hypothetical protein
MTSLATAVDALSLLVVKFATLPVADVALSPIYPGQVTVSLHWDLADFEAWRAALDIAPESVSVRDLPEHLSLSAVAQFAGVEVHLKGYGAPIAAPLAVAS